MTVEALSIVHPAVHDIVAGLKTTEIRSWLPPRLPLYDLVLVENQHYLHNEGDEDEQGAILAVVDVVGAHAWSQEEARQAEKLWQPSYYAWELTNVRPVAEPVKAVARRHIYQLELAESVSLPLNRTTHPQA